MAQAGKIEQQKILRVFKLINLLQGNIGKPVHRLAEYLQTDERTIYRYFKLLEALGFEIVKEFSKYKILGSPGMDGTMNFGSFTEEESKLLSKLVQSEGRGNLLSDSILKKIQVRSEVREGSQQLFKAHLTKFVDEIGGAMQKKVQVWLKDYYSLSSDSTKDRLIEPVAFSSDYSAVHGFELESKQMKIFKLERIGQVVESQNPWEFESEHKLPGTSLFGFTGKNNYVVKLKMTKKAYQLMQEEHPNARPMMYIKNRNQYYFKGEIPQLPGIGRFVLGLSGEIVVEEGDELKAYLEEQIKRFTF